MERHSTAGGQRRKFGSVTNSFLKSSWIERNEKTEPEVDSSGQDGEDGVDEEVRSQMPWIIQGNRGGSQSQPKSLTPLRSR